MRCLVDRRHRRSSRTRSGRAPCLPPRNRSSHCWSSVGVATDAKWGRTIPLITPMIERLTSRAEERSASDDVYLPPVTAHGRVFDCA